MKFKTYLETLITEKGKDLDTELCIEGHYGLTYKMLVDFLDGMTEYHKEIKKTLAMIDFKNGDVFHYFNHLAHGMLESIGYDH